MEPGTARMTTRAFIQVRVTTLDALEDMGPHHTWRLKDRWISYYSSATRTRAKTHLSRGQNGCGVNGERITPSKPIWKNPWVQYVKTFFTEEISWKFPRKKYHEKSRSNFIRNFTYISVESITRSIFLQFCSIFSGQLSQKKNSPSTTLTEIHTLYAFFVHQPACVSKRNWRQQAFVRCREGATSDMRWSTAATTVCARISRDGQRQADAQLCRAVRERITPCKSVSNNPGAIYGNRL